MRSICRIILLAAAIVLACATLFGCGGGDGQSDLSVATTVQDESAGTDSTQNGAQTGAQAETEVAGMPAEFPADVPVHPGTVTAYDPMVVTESTTVHQLTVESVASFDNVIEWYKTQLPAGWSVGFLEESGDGGSREGKVALNGGNYAPASSSGLGGGVLIGVFEGDKTEIVVTVTAMAP